MTQTFAEELASTAGTELVSAAAADDDDVKGNDTALGEATEADDDVNGNDTALDEAAATAAADDETTTADDEATAAAVVLATIAAEEEVLTAAAPVCEATAEAEATPPVPAAARTDETEVQAGFLERFSSYRQASPAPLKVEGTHEYLSSKSQTVTPTQSATARQALTTEA